jgi:hypothetical protein
VCVFRWRSEGFEKWLLFDLRNFIESRPRSR